MKESDVTEEIVSDFSNDISMQTFPFLLLDIKTRSSNGKDTILLIGKTNEKKIVLFDPHYLNYFYVIYDSYSNLSLLIDKLSHLNVKDKDNTYRVVQVQEKIRKYKGKDIEVLKVSVDSGISFLVKAAQEISDILFVLEGDIRLDEKYLFEKKIVSLQTYDITVSEEGVVDGLPRFRLYDCQESTSDLSSYITVGSLDIETYNPPFQGINPKKNPILMIALYASSSKGDVFKRVYTWQSQSTLDKENYFNAFNNLPHQDFSKDDVVIETNETDCLRHFLQDFHEQNIDLLVGYNSDQFDLWYIHERCKELKFSFQIGADFSNITMSRGNPISSSIFGVVHLDIYKIIKLLFAPKLKTKSYSLDAVSKELLSDAKQPVSIKELYSSWDTLSYEKLASFVYYNYYDTYLTFNLYEIIKTTIFELLSVLGGSLFSVSRMSYSKMVEFYLMKQSIVDHELIPLKADYKQIVDRKKESYKGAFVHEPKPGLYHHVAIFDFRSLYPSLMISYNISPETYSINVPDEEKLFISKEDHSFWFSKKPLGFISKHLESIIERRQSIKLGLSQIRDSAQRLVLDAKQYSLKILLNSFYGYLGYFGARWYSIECVKSVTALGRQYITKVIDSLETHGFSIIYGDTDSVFVHLKENSMTTLHSLIATINKDLPGIMHLSFETLCSSVLFVSTKSDSGGAKKKYAALTDNDSIIIKGFETVRRSGCSYVRDIQKELLVMILKSSNYEKALSFIQKKISFLENHLVPLEELKLKTTLTKNIDSYSVITPAVAAAKLILEKGKSITSGTLIEYIISESKSGTNIRDKVLLFEDTKEGDYDVAYYLNHQLLPAIEMILALGGISKKEILNENKGQQSLGSWS